MVSTHTHLCWLSALCVCVAVCRPHPYLQPGTDAESARVNHAFTAEGAAAGNTQHSAARVHQAALQRLHSAAQAGCVMWEGSTSGHYEPCTTCRSGPTCLWAEHGLTVPAHTHSHTHTPAERRKLNGYESIDYFAPNSSVYRKWLARQVRAAGDTL